MWKRIPDFNYEINEDGDIRSVNFQRTLACSTDKDGYKYIGIRKQDNRKKYWFRIHRLVAVAFCNPPLNKDALDVDHVDRNIHNNHYTNLRWATRIENNENRKVSAWSTNKTTGELYITKYRNGYMIRINKHNLKHRSWHKTIEDAILVRNSLVEGVRSDTKFSHSIA